MLQIDTVNLPSLFQNTNTKYIAFSEITEKEKKENKETVQFFRLKRNL